MKKLFGKKDPAVNLREAFQKHEWAEVVRLYDDCETGADNELESMLLQAREKLAELNLQEARTRFSQGDIAAGREHLELAEGYGATSEQLQGADLSPLNEPEKKEVATGSHSSCGSCSTSPLNDAEVDEVSAGQEVDWELLLAGLPDFMAEAYMAKPEGFRLALLRGYEGQDEEACHLFAAYSQEQDVHFCYEYGAALCRSGRVQEGVELLFKVVQMMPDHRFAWELLLDIDASGSRVESLDRMLSDLSEHTVMRGFAAAALARAAWQAGDASLVLEHGKTAVAEGETTPDILQMMAGIFESREEFEQAEQLLSKLPSGGCGGGVHPALAEFWLRRSSHLEQALESFKQASRQESDNPRWMLRIAQTYLAKGWQRDGLKLLKQLAVVDDLPPQLADEVRATQENALKIN